jgi:hypothetical protein
MKQTLLFFVHLFLGIYLYAQDSSQAEKQQSAETLQLGKKDSVDYNRQPSEIDYSNTDTSFLKTGTEDTGANTMVMGLLMDSLTNIGAAENQWLNGDSFRKLFRLQYLTAIKNDSRKEGQIRSQAYEDAQFYGLILLVFLLGITRSFFPSYLLNIFNLSFQPVFRQVQTRQQLSEQSISAVLLNLLFVLSGGMLVSMLALHFQKITYPFFQLFLLASALLLVIYVVKYLFLEITGWAFQVKREAADYIFTVFLMNKVLGIMLIPCLMILAYCHDSWKPVVITACLCLIGLFFLLRYIVLMTRVRKALPVTAFHFLVYICAAEVMPLFLVYKALFFPEKWSV